jgi:hypothetical protein
MGEQTPVNIQWKADVAPPLELKFQVRWATTKKELGTAKWMGLEGEGTYFERSGENIRDVSKTARWLQYRAIFVSPYGCGSPKLREVRIDLS